MSRNSITLDNFASFHGNVRGIEITSNLGMEPYVPSTEIQVHLGRVAQAAHFGHLEKISFTRYSEQELLTPGVDSVSEDGSATASFSTSASRSPRANSSIESVRGGPIFNKGEGKVKINLGHADLDDINLREADPWASYLDSAISEGLRTCNNRQLSADTIYRAAMLAANVIVPILHLKSDGVGEAVHAYAKNVLWYNVVFGSMGKVFGTGTEFSATPGFSLDRLSLSQAYTRTRTFVEAE